jgi:hypothetical protein
VKPQEVKTSIPPIGAYMDYMSVVTMCACDLIKGGHSLQTILELDEFGAM